MLQEVESLLQSLETTLPEVSEGASPEELVAAANNVLDSSEKLVGTLVKPTPTQSRNSVKTNTTGATKTLFHASLPYCHSFTFPQSRESVSEDYLSCIAPFV